MKRIFYLLSILLFLQTHGSVWAQDRNSNRFSNQFEYDSDLFIVKKVTFYKPSTSIFQSPNWIVIKSDFDPNISISGNNSSIAWENGEKIKPIGYVSGVKARVAAEFEILCSGGNDAIYYARATNNDGYNLPPKILISDNGRYKYLPEFVDQVFQASQVKYWENFQLNWQISTSPNGPWLDAGSSKNYLYVTHDKPILTTAVNTGFPTILHHTTLHLSCKNANGLSDEIEIVDAIYNEFMSRRVKRFNGQNDMQYWGPGIFSLFPDCRPVHGLLSLENSTCGTWAQFFNDMIRIHGIEGSIVTVIDWYNLLGFTPNGQLHTMNLQADISTYFNGDPNWFYDGYVDPPTGNIFPYAEFSVKDWDQSLIIPRNFVLSEADMNGEPLSSQFSLILNNGNNVHWIEESGAAGQGYNDPKSEHTNHAVVKYNGEYYDPSYGAPAKGSPNEWENDALDFFQTYIGYRAIINGMVQEVRISWIAESNTNNLQTQFSH